MDYRLVRTLAPIALADDTELRLELEEFSGTRWISLTTWSRERGKWCKLPGSTKLPVALLDEVQNRFTAATRPSRAA